MGYATLFILETHQRTKDLHFACAVRSDPEAKQSVWSNAHTASHRPERTGVVVQWFLLRYHYKFFLCRFRSVLVSDDSGQSGAVVRFLSHSFGKRIEFT